MFGFREFKRKCNIKKIIYIYIRKEKIKKYIKNIKVNKLFLYILLNSFHLFFYVKIK